MVKIQLFQNIVMLHIKLKGITNATSMVANILPADLDPGDDVKRSIVFRTWSCCISN